MANSRPSFQKRQKEMARQQRAADKLQKRLQKKQSTESGVTDPDVEDNLTGSEDSDAEPKGLDYHDF